MTTVRHPALSATDRLRTCYSDRPVVSAGKPLLSQAFAHNEAMFPLYQLTYRVLHIARRVPETARDEGISLHVPHRAVLVTGTRVVTGGGQLKVIIETGSLSSRPRAPTPRDTWCPERCFAFTHTSNSRRSKQVPTNVPPCYRRASLIGWSRQRIG